MSVQQTGSSDEPEVEEVLFGLVRLVPDRLREVPGRRARLARDRAERDEPLQPVEPPAGLDPLLRALPVERPLHRLGGPVAVRPAEAVEDAPRRGERERVDQLLAQEAERGGVEEDRPLAGEAVDAPLRVGIEEGVERQVVGAHGGIISNREAGRSRIDRTRWEVPRGVTRKQLRHGPLRPTLGAAEPARRWSGACKGGRTGEPRAGCPGEVQMIRIRKSDERGHFDHGWLDTRHTFSFADYWDPEHVNFRALRVLNEDRVVPAAGFGTHGHNDMEIVSYVLSGRLAHKDSMGNGSTIVPGDVQYMSAGTGVKHSEFNASESEPVHFVQIWIVPDRRGYAPRYGQKTFAEAQMRGKLRLVASGTGDDGSIAIRQDVNLYATMLGAGESVPLEIAAGQASLGAGPPRGRRGERAPALGRRRPRGLGRDRVHGARRGRRDGAPRLRPGVISGGRRRRSAASVSRVRRPS